MAATWTICKREFGAYFKSPIAYIVLGIYLLFAGALFWSDFFSAGQASMEGFFGNLPFLFLFFGPAVAMRLLAEERGSGTIELLLTMPVGDWQVVTGKYLAAVGVLGVGIALTIPYAITVGKLGPLDTGPVIAGYLGALLLGGTYLAIGLFASALTRNQIIALIVGVAVCLGLFLFGYRPQTFGATVGPVLQYVSPQYHFSKMARGVIELKDVVYYVAAIVSLLVLSVQVLESRKWR